MPKSSFLSLATYIFWFTFLLIFTSCTSSLSIKERDSDDMSMVGSISQTSSTLQTWAMLATPTNSSTWTEDFEDIALPIDDGENRVTKKIFWLQVSPSNSPVSPEKFSGWHTGIDFETTENEQDKEIEITAICTWPLVYKNWVSGYGGAAIQKCTLDSEGVTVLYGHLKQVSITTTLNQEIKTWEKIGILGAWYSTETDGERKHLHLSIHKWTSINLKWYVDSQWELDDWINPMEYLN